MGAMARLRARLIEFVERPERRFALRSRVLKPWHRLRFGSFGDGVILAPLRVVRNGRKVGIGDGTVLFPDCSLTVQDGALRLDGIRLSIGRRVVAGSNVTITCADQVVIGDDVAIGGNCLISDNDHTIDDSGTPVMAMPLRAEPVHIGNGCWIGQNVVIVRGSRIGERCVIGANSVVLSDIPDASIAVGAPARVVGRVGEQRADG